MKYVVDAIVLIFLFVSFPIATLFFTGQKVTLGGIRKMLIRYEYHFYFLFFIFFLKTLVLYFEEPVEAIFSMDFTRMIHDVENNNVLWIQRALYNPWLTGFLIAIYIGSFMFIFTITFAMFAYVDNMKMASQLMFLNFIMLILTIPFYLFVIVYVPSYPKMFYPGAPSMVKSMEPLLYNFNPHINDFFVGNDTFNNCFPSMHIGYPVATLMLLCRQIKGYIRYKIFLFAMILLIGLSILYLGIHWILDIFGGVLIATAGFVLTERWAHPFWKRSYKIINRIERYRKKKGLNILVRRDKKTQ